jgi:hypothetical protein
MKIHHLLIACVATLALMSCDSMDYATPDERQQLLELDEQIATKQSELVAIMEAAETLRADALQLEDLEARKEALEKFELLVTTFDQRREQLVELMGDSNAVVADIRQRTEGTLLGTALPFLPAPVRENLPLISPLLALLWKRPREHAGKAVKSALKLNVGEMLLDLARAMGLRHTTDDPKELVAAAASVAKDKRQDTLAAQLETLAVN